MEFSVVIPLYKCSLSIVELNKRLVSTLTELNKDFEIIYVNDASPENDWDIVCELSKADNRVKGINFSRNFGQHYAITAGLDYSTGNWVIVMDGDLQDQPEEIVKLYNKAQEGYEIVFAQRTKRKDSYFKRWSSKVYYKVLSHLTDEDIDYKVGTFRLLSRSVVDAFCEMREQSRFFGAMINWLGFNYAYVEVDHKLRTYGESAYNFSKSLRLALNGVLSFSDKPLKLAVKFGILIVFLSTLFIIYKIIYAYVNHSTAMGWSSLVASIFFSTGIIVSVLGIVGLYVGRIFEQVKSRPLYIIRETKNIKS